MFRNISIALLLCCFHASLLANDGVCNNQDVIYKNFDASAFEGDNLIANVKPNRFGVGYESLEDGSYRCCNPDGKAFGLMYPIKLNQTVPEPIIATAQSRCQEVEKASSIDYSIYMDIVYSDGTYQWGVAKAFPTGQQGAQWSTQTVQFMPVKPIKSLTMYLLFRNLKGTAWFRNPEFQTVSLKTAQGDSAVFLFDGQLVYQKEASTAQRVPSADSDQSPVRYYFQEFYNGSSDNFIDGVVKLAPTQEPNKFSSAGIEVLTRNGKTIICNRTGSVRSITFIKAVKVNGSVLRWHGSIDAATSIRNIAKGGTIERINSQIEFSNCQNINAGTKRLARFPIAGVTLQDGSSCWLGIAPDYPAVYRLFYNDRTNELCIAYDLAFTPQRNQWTLSDVNWTMSAEQSKEEFRSAWAQYMRLFPEAFRCNLPRSANGEPILGNWMPFQKINSVEGWEDFAFRFMEGTGNEQWDDEHGILTYRYTEPMTWWMHMSKDLPRTLDAAIAEVKRQAENGSKMAQAWENCVMRDRNGAPVGRLKDTPWCFGCVWSMYSVPTLPKPNQFELYWQKEHVLKNYPTDKPVKKTKDGFTGLDGEYIDSAEGYVTAELDFAPSHLLAADRPLTFDPFSKQPAIYRGLVTFEYIQAISKDVRKAGKSMMANSTPHQLTWLVPLCDVLGTETNWNWRGNWRPSSTSDLLRKRALCGEKPFCFLQNTDFSKFSFEHTEKFMKRSLAFGMFPGFFSANASTGHYFSQPQLYNRDRPLFKKYMPIILAVAQAGWQPERLVQLESGEKDKPVSICCERFESKNNSYLTFFNPEKAPQTVMVALPKGYKLEKAILGSECVSTDKPGVYELALDPEDVAVWKLEKQAVGKRL